MRALILAPFSEAQLDRLRAHGRADVIYESWLDTNRLQDPDELGARLHREAFDALVVEADFVFEEVFAAAPGLRFVGVCRNALNHVDIESATERGVAVVHARGRNTNAVAELVIAQMFALARRTPEAHRMVNHGGWADPSAGYRTLRGREIAGSAVGIVGFGQIGRAVATKSMALGATVLVYDPFVAAGEIESAGGMLVTLADLAARSDFVSLHVPDSDETRHMVDVAFLARMQAGSFLISTGGGEVVDSAALAESLRAGAIAGAAIDVFEGHPISRSHPLLTAPNVLLTPHIGGATAETVERHSRIVVDEVERFLDGQPLQFCVNPEYKMSRAR